MPNRILKESINESKCLSECSFFAQDTYKRLITYADDYGRFNADIQIMRARLYPRELDIVSERDMEDALIELAGVEKITFYTSSTHKEIYGCFPNWGEHQRLRESKAKYPEPDDMEVNDWYLRRFVPLAMKVDIIERDSFKCQECGKFLTSCTDAKKFVKSGSGLFHIDHIVPCQQGGRATMENMRLLCPNCNLKRKRLFTFDEFAQMTIKKSNPPRTAASCRMSPPELESEFELESESEYNNNTLPVEPACPRPSKPDIPALYAELCPNLPQIRAVTDKRKAAINRLIKQIKIEDIKNAFAIFNQSDFCLGLNDRGWKADFDFCIKPESIAKALEGKYDTRTSLLPSPNAQPGHKETVNERNNRMLESFFSGGDVIDAVGTEVLNGNGGD